jgi:serine/threonine-protein kinase RsbW
MAAPVADLTTELSIHADASEVRRASDWLEEAGLAFGVPAEQIGRLDLCLHEALANVISHGGTAALSAPVRLRLAVGHGERSGEAAVTVSDAGVAFDPLAAEPKPQPNSLAEAEPGGLGVVMIRAFSDSLRYRHDEGRNQLTFGVRWADAG